MSREIIGREGVAYSTRTEWGYYNRGHKVRVISPRAAHFTRVGVVAGAYNDGGDMVHHVAFDGGDTGDYFTDELVSVQGGNRTGKHNYHKGTD